MSNCADLGIARYCYSYKVTVPSCVDSFIFSLNNSYIDIVLHFVDKFGKVYKYLASTDINGDAEVDLLNFPKGLFNPYAGNFTVYAVPVGMPAGDRIFFRDDSGYYPSLLLQVEDSVYTNYSQPGSHRVELSTFRCCCTASTSCSNLTIAPCTGSGNDCELCCGSYADFLEVAQAFFIALDTKEAYLIDTVNYGTPGFPYIVNLSSYFQFSNTEYYIAAGPVPGEFILYKRDTGNGTWPLNDGVPVFDCYLPFSETNNITNANIPILPGEVVKQCITFRTATPEDCRCISICWEVSVLESINGPGVYRIENMQVCISVPDEDTGAVFSCKECDYPVSEACEGITLNGFIVRDAEDNILNAPYVFTGETNITIEIDFTLPDCCRDDCYFIRLGNSYNEGEIQLLDSPGFTFPAIVPAKCPAKTIPITILEISPLRPDLDGNWMTEIIIDTIHCDDLVIPFEYIKA
jgi:hypothetical protein